MASFSHPTSLHIRLLCLRTKDTAVAASFYRIYQFFVIHDNINFRNELEYFCSRVVCFFLPNPRNLASRSSSESHDPDAHLRYTVLAILTRIMCDSFNRRIELGQPRDAPAIIEDFEEFQARTKVYDEPPEWAKLVQPLPRKAFIPSADEDVTKEFKDINVIIQMPHIHFI